MGLGEQDQSFLISLGAVSGVALACILLFSFLRERVPRFWMSRQHWQKVPAKCATGFFAWIRSALAMKDDQLFEEYGLDVVMYQRWLWTMFMCFLIMFFISLLTLMPLDVIGENKYRATNDSLATRGIAIVSMANIDSTNNQVRYLWAHFISVFVFSAIPLILFQRDWKYYSKASAHTRALELPSNYTVMVYGLPPRIRNLGDPAQADRELADVYRVYFGEEVDHAHVSIHNDELSAFVKEYHQLERELEVAYYKWRHTTVRPMMFCGDGPLRIWPPWKPRVDAIEWLTARRDVVYRRVCKLQESRNERIVSLGFIRFRNQVDATMAGQVILSRNRFRFRAIPAPDPRDVEWEHVHIGHISRGIRKFFVYSVFAAMVVFWMLPVLFAASITNLTRLSKLGAFRWLKGFLDWKPALSRLIEGLLPVLIVNVSFLIALPLIRFIASHIGLWRRSEAERVARNVLLFLLVFNVLLVYTISGTIFFNLDFFLNSSLTQIVDLLAQTIPQQAYYFASYVMTNGLLGCSLLLLRPHFCIAWLFLRYVWASSPAEKHEADRPFIFEFDESYARASLAAIITLTYATMFPVILIFGIIYFFFLYIVFRYNAQYVNVPHYEGFGRQFPFAYTAIVIGLTIYQLTMFGVLQLGGFWPAPGLLPLPAITWIVWHRTRERHLKPVNRGALNTLKSKGLLARQHTNLELRKLSDLKKGLEVDMNRSESDISLNDGSHINGPDGKPSLKPTQFATATDLIASQRIARKSMKKSPYLQPERRKLKPPFDFTTRSRSFVIADRDSLHNVNVPETSSSDNDEEKGEMNVERKEKERTDVSAPPPAKKEPSWF